MYALDRTFLTHLCAYTASSSSSSSVIKALPALWANCHSLAIRKQSEPPFVAPKEKTGEIELSRLSL